MKINQKGSSAVILLVVIIVLGAIVGTGFMVYGSILKNKTKPTPANQVEETKKVEAKKLELTELNLVVSDTENRGLELETKQVTPLSGKAWSIYYITQKDNKYEETCGFPIGVYSTDERTVKAQEATAKAQMKTDTSIKYLEIDGSWYSVGVGEAYNGTEYCKSGKPQDGYKEYVEDLISYISKNISRP